MLEEVLKTMNSNLEKIVEVLSQNKNTKNKADINISQDNQTQEIIKKEPVIREPIPKPIGAVVNQIQIPIAQSQENFTQEQIARAMASAMDLGKPDIIQKILSTYNAQSLMDIKQENYNQIAVILREAGIKV